jgi:hypothetical protein
MPDAPNLEQQAYTLLAQRFTAMEAELGYPVAKPSVAFTPPRDSTKDKNRLPYVDVAYMPNGAQLDSLGFDQADESLQGLLQLSVYWPAAQGLVKPSAAAGRVAAYFSAGTRLDGGGFTVYVDRRPDTGPAMYESDLVMLPVTVRWRATRTPA